MNVEQVVREVTVRGSAPGMADVARAYDQVSTASDKNVIAFERTTKASEGVDRALEKLRLRYQDGYREQQKYIEAQEVYSRAVEQGRLTQAQAASELDQVKASLDGVADAQDQASRAANDNNRSFAESGVEALKMAAHLKTAGAAAYALSPAFRGVVNQTVLAGLRTVGPTVATSFGIAGTAAGSLLTAVSRIALPITAVIQLFRAMAAITELGAQKIKEFADLAANAGAAGVSNDFFQRQAKGAEDTGIKIDDATAALKRFKDASDDRLGGSDFSKRLDELTKAGNFTNNAGVAAYKQAVTVEEKYRAAGQIISIAIERGERLAGLDLAAKFLPPEMLERLRANGELLRDLQRAADDIKPADIVDQEQIGYALALKSRLEEAERVIADGLKPLQKDLTQLGLNYQESWVNIKEVMASAVTLANQLYGWIKAIPAALERAGNASFWGRLTQWGESKGLNARPDGLVKAGEAGFDSAEQGSPARSRLAAILQDQAAVQRAMREASAISSRVRGDTSRAPQQDAKAQQDINDAIDRAINTLNRHVLSQQADAKAVGLGAKALAEYRAEAQRQAAVTANGGKITAEQSAEFDRLKNAAGEAALALEKARVASDIDFANKTRFLSDKDVAIARQLSGIYGNDVPAALASSEAAALRLNDQIKQARTDSLDFTKDLVHGLISGKSLMQSLGDAASNLSAKLTDRALESLFSGDFVSAGIQGIGALVTGLFGASQKKKQEQAKIQAEYQRNLATIDNYIAKANGKTSDLTDKLLAAQQEMDSLVAVAAKAGQWAKVTEIQQAYNLNVARINAEEVKRIQDEIAARRSNASDRIFNAANDNSTLQGQLAAMDRKFAQERLDEVKAGGEALNDLQAAQEAERYQTIRKFADDARDYITGVARTINDYLTGLKLGKDSTLSPQQQLALAQKNYDEQLALAQGGDKTALGGITNVAQALIDQARGYYASSGGYGDIFNRVNSSLSGLTQPGGVSGYSAADFAAAATQPSTLGTGSSPSAANDNSDAIAAARENARAIAESNRSDADRIIAKLDEILDEIEQAPAKTKTALRQLVEGAKQRAAA